MPYQPDTGAARGLVLPTSSGAVTGSGYGAYCGITVAETSGAAAASVILYDNASAASGLILEYVQLPKGTSFSSFYPRPSREVTNGIYAAVTGVFAGSVWQ